jgi:hypothetical protein
MARGRVSGISLDDRERDRDGLWVLAVALLAST